MWMCVDGCCLNWIGVSYVAVIRSIHLVRIDDESYDTSDLKPWNISNTIKDEDFQD